MLDLEQAAHADVARALCADADVVVENNRPGVMGRLGLGYEQLSELNPKLVYSSISAFGQSGPRAEEGGFDLTIQAAAGVMSVTGESDDAPVKCARRARLSGGVAAGLLGPAVHRSSGHSSARRDFPAARTDGNRAVVP